MMRRGLQRAVEEKGGIAGLLGVLLMCALAQTVGAQDGRSAGFWEQREAAASTGPQASPVRIGIWDSGVDLALFPGQVALDAAGHSDVVILAYSAKYASAFYGPFRDAVESTLTGDRRTYQLDPGNGREGVLEALIDIDEGADIVMVKPAGPYLDVLAEVAAVSAVPVWAYQVSGEYAMIEHAAAAGVIDRDRAIGESLLGIRRAGAEAILTYWAIEVAGWLNEGRRLA